jgi:hypothetical protein
MNKQRKKGNKKSRKEDAEFWLKRTASHMLQGNRLPVSAALVRGFIQYEDAFIYFPTLDPEVGNLTSDDKR